MLVSGLCADGEEAIDYLKNIHVCLLGAARKDREMSPSSARCQLIVIEEQARMLQRELGRLNLRRPEECQAMVRGILDRVLQIGNEIGNIREPEEPEAPKTPA